MVIGGGLWFEGLNHREIPTHCKEKINLFFNEIKIIPFVVVKTSFRRKDAISILQIEFETRGIKLKTCNFFGLFQSIQFD